MIHITPQQFGATGAGTDDTKAFADALAAIQEAGGGMLYVPPGEYYAERIVIPRLECPLTISGCGAGVTEIQSEYGIDIGLAQVGLRQPFRLHLANFSLSTAGRETRETGITVRAHHFGATNEHYNSPLRISNVEVVSDAHFAWANGIRLVGVWNAQLENLFVTGATRDIDAVGGDWSALRGSGITLEDMCVNATLTNVHTNFWAEGLKAHAAQLNTEGIFCTGCTMVGVKRGVWLRGNPAGGPGPRIHTFQWQGGMIENRAGKVTGGIAAFHFENVWSASIQGCQMITETMDTLEPTYGVIPQDCRRVLVSGCEINAYHHAFLSTGEAEGHVVAHNSFPNCSHRVTFNEGASNCIERSNT